MAKAKRSKTEAADDGEAFGADGWDIQRVAVHLLIALGLAGGCAGAFYYMQSYVDETVAAPVDRPQIVFGCGPHDLPQGACDPPLATDHLADIVRRYVQVQDHDVLALFANDLHLGGVVHEPARKLLEQVFH